VVNAIAEQMEDRRDPAPAGAGGRSRLRGLLSYSYPVPQCVPYWGPSTYRTLLRCLLRGQVIEGPAAERLAQRTARLLSVPGAIPFGSGRGAIEAALRAARVPPGSEVIVPTFCCASILPPIIAVGAVPAFADVDENLSLSPGTLADAANDRTRAVIVPHLFGNPVAIDAIAEWCRRRRLMVIDDAAQALGASIRGRPLGGFGDAGILSFGNGKVCFGTGGGVLVSHDPELLARARALPQDRGDLGGGLRNALGVLVWRRWRRWSLPLQMILSRIGRSRGRSPRPLPGAMRNLDAAVALTLLDTLEENLCARRERVSAYRELLGAEPRLKLIAHGAGSACLTQVVQVARDGIDDRPARRAIAALREQGFEVTGSFRPLHLAPPWRPYAGGPLALAERVWEDLFELPCEPSISLAQVGRAAATVREVLR
jgi:dTDP-4-amino-4,6-dideoxygalactose transaminase